MRRLLAVPFSCVLLGGLLLAVDECPKPPSPSKQCPTMTNGCPASAQQADGVCRVRLDFSMNIRIAWAPIQWPPRSRFHPDCRG